ncbi:hypothetical protein ACFY12_34440 [Streptomyces sp. NPDC001339]|uniref:Mu transposase domain-containing protein n=1 Tax=Streptomyces sp. NPDC001339 TaxID=3364563 RepID=UPI00367D0873
MRRSCRPAGRPRPSARTSTSKSAAPYYSVPWKLIGRRVDVRSTATLVQVFRDGDLVKTHASLDQGKRTDKNDCPPEKITFQMRTPVWCRPSGFALRQLTAAQADDFYELVSERQGRSLIITSNRAPSKAHMFRRTRARQRLNSTGSRSESMSGSRTYPAGCDSEICTGRRPDQDTRGLLASHR